MYKNILYLLMKLSALAAICIYNIPADMPNGFSFISVLAFCCLFLINFLIGKVCCLRRIALPVCIIAEIVFCFISGIELYFTLFVMILFQFIDLFETDPYFYYIVAVLALLSTLIFEPDLFSISLLMALLIIGTFARIMVGKIIYYMELSEQLRENVLRQNNKISELKKYSKTLRETVSLEERSRFSTRIHDKLGHGISGSIILLEGVKLNIKKNPDQAIQSLETVIENLRGSVDEIRGALREERPKRNIASIASFKEMMEHFSVSYGIKTDFSIKGDTQKIESRIWNCLKENLTEALTNLVKHSNAKHFSFRIVIHNKIVHAEFLDDGDSAADFVKGMGLEAMEERTAVCDGKIMFQNGSSGFKIIHIFRL